MLSLGSRRANSASSTPSFFPARLLSVISARSSGGELVAAMADPLIAIAGGGGVPSIRKGMRGLPTISRFAADARAKIVYERLINFCDDAPHQGRA
jgi:hypothetical protein